MLWSCVKRKWWLFGEGYCSRSGMGIAEGVGRSYDGQMESRSPLACLSLQPYTWVSQAQDLKSWKVSLSVMILKTMMMTLNLMIIFQCYLLKIAIRYNLHPILYVPTPLIQIPNDYIDPTLISQIFWQQFESANGSYPNYDRNNVWKLSSKDSSQIFPKPLAGAGLG